MAVAAEAAVNDTPNAFSGRRSEHPTNDFVCVSEWVVHEKVNIVCVHISAIISACVLFHIHIHTWLSLNLKQFLWLRDPKHDTMGTLMSQKKNLLEKEAEKSHIFWLHENLGSLFHFFIFFWLALALLFFLLWVCVWLLEANMNRISKIDELMLLCAFLFQVSDNTFNFEIM